MERNGGLEKDDQSVTQALSPYGPPPHLLNQPSLPYSFLLHIANTFQAPPTPFFLMVALSPSPDPTPPSLFISHVGIPVPYIITVTNLLHPQEIS